MVYPTEALATRVVFPPWVYFDFATLPDVHHISHANNHCLLRIGTLRSVAMADAVADYEFRDLEEPRLPVHSVAEATPTKRQHYLDGLRGLAALLVYFYHHIGWHYGPEDDIFKGFGVRGPAYIAQLPFLRVFFTGGHAAVAVFFVLSGYVLSIGPLKLIKEGQITRCYTSLNSSAIRRPFRLFVPTAGVSLIFALALHLPFGLAPTLAFPQPLPNVFAELARWITEFIWLLNPLLSHRTQGRWFLYDPPAYTMAMELTGSLFIFVLLACSASIPTRWRMVSLIAIWLLCLFTYRWVLTGFVGGMVLALNELEGFDEILLVKRVSGQTKNVIYHVFFVTGWYLLCAPGAHDHPEYLLEAPGWGLLGQLIPSNYMADEYFRFWDNFGAFFLLYSLLRISWLQTLFTRRPLRYLGRVSLSLYLIHAPLMYTVGDRIYRLFGRVFQTEITTWFDNKVPIQDFGIHGLSSRWLICQALILPITLALAEVGTILLDLPSIRVGRWVVEMLHIGS